MKNKKMTKIIHALIKLDQLNLALDHIFFPSFYKNIACSRKKINLHSYFIVFTLGLLDIFPFFYDGKLATNSVNQRKIFHI